MSDATKALIARVRELDRAAAPGPWHLCHHLRPGGDASCSCGYRGGIWGGDQEHTVCEMGGADPMLPRYERPTEIANAALIAEYRTLAVSLAAALEAKEAA